MSPDDNQRHGPTRLSTFVTTDLCGITRGRALPEHEVEQELETGCGWVPANSSLTPQDIMAAENPWGSLGDLRIIPDPATRVIVNVGPDPRAAPLDYIQGNLALPNGELWGACPRTLLNAEITRYEELGLQVTAAFEHEFNLIGLPAGRAPSFSLQAQRRSQDFGGWLVSALQQAGAQPEMFLPEYGQDQYEITCRPSKGVAAADRAVNVREITREIARQFGWGSSFTPLLVPGGITNGVHLHLSLQTPEGTPVFYDASSSNTMSAIAKHWAAGVLHHLPALCALTAPTAVSYLRLKPSHWSAAYACLGLRNREAALRICPGSSSKESAKASQFNLEYRPMDATASPHLAMAAVLIAGRLGIEQQLSLSAVTDVDPHILSPTERESLGIKPLPASLEEALRVLLADTALCSQLPPELLKTFVSMKRQELILTCELSEEQLCDSYAEIY